MAVYTFFNGIAVRILLTRKCHVCDFHREESRLYCPCILQTASKGVLFGSGRQTVGAILLFISFFLIGFPLGIPLMFLTSLRTAGNTYIGRHFTRLLFDDVEDKNVFQFSLLDRPCCQSSRPSSCSFLCRHENELAKRGGIGKIKVLSGFY